MEKYIVIFLFTIISWTAKAQENVTTDTDSLFNSIVTNPETHFKRNSYTDGTVKEFYELQGPFNQWSAFKEYHANGTVKEKGVFLNGYHFQKWVTYDEDGKITTILNYATSQKIKGPDLGYEKKFAQCKTLADSLITTHFSNPAKFRLHACRSYWYSASGSGRWFEPRTEAPTEFLLRYSYQHSDTLSFDVITLNFDANLNLIADKSSGLPNEADFKFEIDYPEALAIARSKNYRLTLDRPVLNEHNNLQLTFLHEDQSYHWRISKLLKSTTESKKSRQDHATIKQQISTLYINAATGQVTETFGKGSININ